MKKQAADRLTITLIAVVAIIAIWNLVILTQYVYYQRAVRHAHPNYSPQQVDEEAWLRTRIIR